MARAMRLMRGDFRQWNEHNVNALSQTRCALTRENADLLRRFAALRERRGPVGVWRLARSGLYRQTWDGQLGLYVGALFGRL